MAGWDGGDGHGRNGNENFSKMKKTLYIIKTCPHYLEYINILMLFQKVTQR